MLNIYKLIFDGQTLSLLGSNEGEAGYRDYAFHFHVSRLRDAIRLSDWNRPLG